MSLAAAAGVVPWLASSPPGRVAPPLAPPCTAGSLAATAALQGETGSLGGAIVLANRSIFACSLAGTPRLRLVGGGNPAGLVARKNAALASDSGVPYPSLRALQPDESAQIYVSWSNWCGPEPAAIAVQLRGIAKTLRIRGIPPRCDSPSRPSTLEWGPLQPRAVRTKSGRRLPLIAAIVEHRGSKTVIAARRGTVAVFHIELTNTSPRAFAFGKPCPLFVETLNVKPSHVELHRLNCRAAGTIGPGKTIVFEMHVRVPTDAARGSASFTWSLAPVSVNSPFAGAAFRIS